MASMLDIVVVINFFKFRNDWVLRIANALNCIL